MSCICLTAVPYHRGSTAACITLCQFTCTYKNDVLLHWNRYGTVVNQSHKNHVMPRRCLTLQHRQKQQSWTANRYCFSEQPRRSFGLCTLPQPKSHSTDRTGVVGALCLSASLVPIVKTVQSGWLNVRTCLLATLMMVLNISQVAYRDRYDFVQLRTYRRDRTGAR